MFDFAPRTLQRSLRTALNNPQEYLADFSFVYPEQTVWAHRGILLARTPLAFQKHFIPPLNSVTVDARVLTPRLLRVLLQFWYTSEFSLTGSSETDSKDDMHAEVQALEKLLGTPVLPPSQSSPEYWLALVGDLQKMHEQRLACDVFVQIRSESSLKNDQADHRQVLSLLGAAQETPTLLPAHRFILAARSTYFYALFCTQFSEIHSPTVYLPQDLFSPIVLQVILDYFYSDVIRVLPLPFNASLSTVQRRMLHKRHVLRVLQKLYNASDYLGDDTLCKAALSQMAETCDAFRCVCSDCAALLPSMLSFADKLAVTVPELLRTLLTLYADPVHSLAPLWSQKTFAILVGSMKPIKEEMRAAGDIITAPQTLVQTLSQLMFRNITKHNAIHVLHSLHLCLSQIRSADVLPTWSLPTLDLLNPVVHDTVRLVSQNFDFYCVEYPILMSCVDGIGAGFSIDFLDFLLKRVLSEGIQNTNAGVIYQGIVRDLLGRQEVVKNVAMDDVLADARAICASYLGRRWMEVKTQGGFQKVDKETMHRLSDDINVPYRVLSKPVDSDLAAMFGFKPKASKVAAAKSSNHTAQVSVPSSSTASRSLSLGHFRSTRYSRSIAALQSAEKSHSRPRSRSTESAIENYIDPITLPTTSSSALPQSLGHLISLETEPGRQTRVYNDHSAAFRHSIASLTDVLLPLDVEPRDTTATETPRPSRLKFELPTAPIRAKSPSDLLIPRHNKFGRSPRRTRWSLGSSSDASDDEDVTKITPVVGARIKLLRRPLPTFGTIQYVGPVSFSKGIWIGVELESRLGKTDGAVDGVRYFQTDAQRGVFLRPDDFTILALPTTA